MVMLLGTSLAARGQSNDALPRVDDIKAQVDNGKYNDALKGLTRLLVLKGPAAESLNRVELFMLRAECQLQTRQIKPAMEALDSARKEAFANGKPDDAAPAVALACLINKSNNYRYTPKTAPTLTGQQPIDILDRKARPDAFKALFPDELPNVKVKARLAADAATMPPVLDTAREVFTLACVEKVANNDNSESKEVASDLLTHAVALLTGGVARLEARTTAIGSMANSVVAKQVEIPDLSGKMSPQWVNRRVGLNSNITTELQGIKTTCGQITSACNELKLELATDGDVFRDILAKTAAVKAKVDVILNDNYDDWVR
jgi:hypothetical protein